MYYFDPGGLSLGKGTAVIVETQLGVEYGVCVTGPFQVEDERIVPPLRKVIRIATDYDKKTLEQILQKEKEALNVCRQKVEKHGLVMKVVEVDYTFDGNKIIFYFTADGRVDFRELVKDLASVFRTRIELRQIGVRDEARMLGGLGVCGKTFCCSTFLDEFQPVSIKMAKEQNLSLNPTKISGTCGRLMCCLKYEQSAYEHLHSITPRVDSVVQTPHGRGTVTDVSLLRGNIKVRLDSSPDSPPRPMHRTDVKIIKPGRNLNSEE
jgi:cell fate regulator YaaT (PSP1 superfamily)